MIEVSAGIIQRADGKICICQRGEGRKNAHLWEFPGGKREENETAARCLVRELQEELSLQVSPPRVVYTDEWEGIRFSFLFCQALNIPTRTEHEDIRFVEPREMLSYPFCPADTEVANNLAVTNPILCNFFWDFDGTLADTCPVLSSLLCKTCEIHGFHVDLPRALRLMKIESRFAIETLAAEHHASAEEMTQTFQTLERETPAAAYPPIPGILDAIQRMPGNHYLVTHRGALAKEWLVSQGIDKLFIDSVTRENGLARKPSPDMLFYLINRHSLDPDTCVMIGDRTLDIRAGQAANVLTCLLDTDHLISDCAPTWHTADASALPQIICPSPIIPIDYLD